MHTLLLGQNHPRLRVEGARLLLLVLNTCMEQAPHDAILLYQTLFNLAPWKKSLRKPMDQEFYSFLDFRRDEMLSCKSGSFIMECKSLM